MVVTVKNFKNKENLNINNVKKIRIDRKSNLGNPFYMKNESYRNEVCNKYKEWIMGLNRNSIQWKEVRALQMMNKNNINIDLMCWCAPKRCHGDIIKELIEKEAI